MRIGRNNRCRRGADEQAKFIANITLATSFYILDAGKAKGLNLERWQWSAEGENGYCGSTISVGVPDEIIPCLQQGALRGTWNRDQFVSATPLRGLSPLRTLDEILSGFREVAGVRGMPNPELDELFGSLRRVVWLESLSNSRIHFYGMTCLSG